MADLTQYGVPTGQNAVMMPKLQYRFRVYLLNFGFAPTSIDVTQNVVSVTRPSLTHDEITLDAYNSRAYLAAKHTWEPITLTVRDDMNNHTSSHFAGQIKKQLDHGLQSATNSRAGLDYKFGMLVEQLDGTQPGEVLETWSLNGCFIQNINYGENNYATSDVMLITAQIRYDGADIHDSSVPDAALAGALTMDIALGPHNINKATG